jgi:hypothetical protein
VIIEYQFFGQTTLDTINTRSIRGFDDSYTYDLLISLSTSGVPNSMDGLLEKRLFYDYKLKRLLVLENLLTCIDVGTYENIGPVPTLKILWKVGNE